MQRVSALRKKPVLRNAPITIASGLYMLNSKSIQQGNHGAGPSKRPMELCVDILKPDRETREHGRDAENLAGESENPGKAVYRTEDHVLFSRKGCGTVQS